MNLLQNTRKQAARGLTLIELVVVLAILVALVGLVLAFFPGLLSRASKSTSATSIQDIAKAVQINYSTQLSYGSGYDSLVNSGGAAVFTKLTANAKAQVAVHTLTVNDAIALKGLGINVVYHLLDNIDGDATFGVTELATQNAVASGLKVAEITDPAVRTKIRGNTTVGTGTANAAPHYVVLGVNKGATIVGSSSILQDAPVRAGADANENPTTSYQRYGLVFLLDGADGATTRTARFLGAVAFGSAGITTAEDSLQGYYGN
jgi:prepilin-type N-terminal cleavage/methylation domain-containing protein